MNEGIKHKIHIEAAALAVVPQNSAREMGLNQRSWTQILDSRQGC